MKLEVKFDNDTERFLKQFALQSQGALDKAIGQGTKMAAQYVLAEIINRIDGKKYEGLAFGTLVMRGFDGYGNIPLKRTGALIRSIAREIVSTNEAQVGLLMQRRSKSGPQSFANIGQLLHDGGVIKVTPAMRRAFARRWGAIEAATGTKFRSAPGSGGGFIRIKPRRFIGDVFDDPKVEAYIQRLYLEEIERAFNKLGGA